MNGEPDQNTSVGEPKLSITIELTKGQLQNILAIRFGGGGTRARRGRVPFTLPGDVNVNALHSAVEAIQTSIFKSLAEKR